jgi:formiminotetrahydrofolate cyclodeaminase
MYKEALKKYLDDLASRRPVPGGGSAAALVAATGISLISMVANFTIGKDKYKNFAVQAKEISSSSCALRQRLLNLVDTDVIAYEKLSRAYKMPKKNSEDKKKRAEAIQEGLKQALTPPVDICKCCHEGIKLCLPLAQKGNVNLITDVGIASVMLQCAFQSAMYNVEINLKSIQDERFILEIREILEPMEKDSSIINNEVHKEIDKHLVK